MSDVYFKASLQNTLNPEVGTFDNVGNKEGTFTLEDGEYYLTNNTSTSYRVFYPTKNIYSAGFTIEFDLNYDYRNNFNWCLLFNGDDEYWFGIGVNGADLEFRGHALSNYHLITSPNTWLHVKCIFDYDHNQNYVDIYIDNVKVNNFNVSKYHGIKYIDILGNSGGFASTAKIKNIIIYNSSKKHYLDTTGLTSFWSKIKSLFATKTELASKANISDLSTVAASGDYNDLINKPDISKLDDMDEYGSLHVTRDTDGNFFVFTHNSWSASPVNAWGGMYFRTSDDHNVFGFAARQSSFPIEKFSVGNNGYLRGYDTNGKRSVTLVINGGTADQPDTQNITVDGTFVNAGNQQPYSANMYTIGTPYMPYESMYAGTFNTANPSGDSGLIASKSNTGYSLLFGIGGIGVNRGIYDKKNSRWPVFLDDTDYIMTQCPTPPEGDSSNKLATTEWVQNELAKLRQALRDIQNPENPENP